MARRLVTVGDDLTLHSSVIVPAAQLDSDTATDGHVLTADGAGGVAWEAAPGGGGSVATDTVWDAKGDLAAGTGADTAARLAVGTNGLALVADSAQATGLAWAAPAPAAHTHTLSDVTDAGGAAALNVGTTAGTVAAGDDSRLSDARTPTAHASTHATGQTDAIAPGDIGAATAAQGALADTALQPATGQTLNAQTGTTYTLVAGDAGKIVTLTNGSSITCTLPQDSAATFATGARVDFLVLGAGMVTWAADGGSTVNGTPSLVSRAQYSAATAIKTAADTWVVVGDLATP